MVEVRFEVCPLRPLIPCVDEDNLVPRRRGQCLPARRSEPRLITGRRGAMEREPSPGAPGFIVPAGTHPGEEGVFSGRLRETVADHVVVGMHLAGKISI